MTKVWRVFFGLIFTSGLYAVEASHPSFQDATDWAKSNVPSVSNGVQQFKPETIPGFVTAAPKEIDYQTDLSERAASESLQSELAKIMRQNFINRPTGIINKQEAWLQKGFELEQNANPAADLTGHYTDCNTASPVMMPQYQSLSCDEFTDADSKRCTVGQVVEVDAKHSYQCQSTRLSEKLSCQKILNIRMDEQIEKNPSCQADSEIAAGHGLASLYASVRCEVESPTLSVHFVCGWRQVQSVQSVTVNGSGTLNFSDCKPKKRNGDTVGRLPYTLTCDLKEQCTLVVGRSKRPHLSLSFARPRMIATVHKVPVDVWDNQCAALEGRTK